MSHQWPLTFLALRTCWLIFYHECEEEAKTGFLKYCVLLAGASFLAVTAAGGGRCECAFCAKRVKNTHESTFEKIVRLLFYVLSVIVSLGLSRSRHTLTFEAVSSHLLGACALP